MGAYLSEPVTQKISDDETSATKRIVCGSSSMQGWRTSQEDAHNVIMDFDENTSYFAVYDGHGGSEVAAYCSVNLPEFLKKLESFKKRDFEKALVDAFLGFDKTLTEPEIVKKLKKMAVDDYESVEEEHEEEDEEVSELYQEATMSLDELLKKYKPKGKEDEPEKEDITLPKGRIHSLKGQSKRKPSSPALRPKRPSSFSSQGDTEEGESSSGEGHTSNSEEKEEAKPKGDNEKSEAQESCKEETVEVTKVNGTLEKEKETSFAGSGVNLPPTPSIKGKGKGKGKSKVSTKTSSDIGQDEVMDLQPVVKVDKLPVRVSPRKAKELYKSITEVSNSNGNADESESDESDADFDAGKDESDHSSDDAVNGGSEEEDSDEYETVDEEEEEEPESVEEEEDTAFLDCMKHEPGNDSGCTAVVAILSDQNIYVANAGDSRAVLCRGGKAIDLSEDHKPEDDREQTRIKKAGGSVTAEGRVNGGLNLSRAIGDHGYKRNKTLSQEEQMITALPDVLHKELDPDLDEFVILACDGIWNSMTSQEAVDFVRERIQKGEASMSKICESLFDSCIAPNTHGDGTGCDNMTAIIVQLFKDPPPPPSEEKTSPIPEQSQTSQEGEVVVHLKDILHDSSTNDTNYTEENSMDQLTGPDENASDRKRSSSPVGEDVQNKKQKTE